jgi:hypothetical protein
MAEKFLTPKGEPKAVGLHRLIEEFNLKVPLPAVRSEVISGARRTTVTDGKVPPAAVSPGDSIIQSAFDCSDKV